MVTNCPHLSFQWSCQIPDPGWFEISYFVLSLVPVILGHFLSWCLLIPSSHDEDPKSVCCKKQYIKRMNNIIIYFSALRHSKMSNFWLSRVVARNKLWQRRCPGLNFLPRCFAVFYFHPSKKKKKQEWGGGRDIDWGRRLGLPHSGYCPPKITIPKRTQISNLDIISWNNTLI